MTWIYTTLCHLHRPGHSQSSMWHWMWYSSLNFKEFSATTSTIGADFRIYQGTHPKKLVGKKQNSKFVLMQKYLKSLSGLLIIGLLGAVSGRPVIICCIDHFLPCTYGPCHPHVARMLLLWSWPVPSLSIPGSPHFHGLYSCSPYYLHFSNKVLWKNVYPHNVCSGTQALGASWSPYTAVFSHPTVGYEDSRRQSLWVNTKQARKGGKADEWGCREEALEKQGALWFQVVVHLAEKVTGEQAWKERREGAMGVSEREHPGPRTVRARNVCVSWGSLAGQGCTGLSDSESGHAQTPWVGFLML